MRSSTHGPGSASVELAAGSLGFSAARQNDDDLLVGAGELELRVDQAIEAASKMAAAIVAHDPDG